MVIISILILNGIIGSGGSDIAAIAERTCSKMSAKEMHEMGYANTAECAANMSNMIFWVFAMVIALAILIYLHFCQVVYTHWKNSNLARSKGGLVADDDVAGLAQRADEE